MAFISKETLVESLISYSARDFVSHFIFEPVPYIFANDLPSWIRWKSELGMGLEVDPKDIVLTGSAALGYSLNPHKNYKLFDDGSDIDCGIISPYHFDVAWRFLRQKRPEWLTLDMVTKTAIKKHRRNYVFEGTIATDKMLGILPFGKVWQAALDKMGGVAPTDGRDVKLRIYKDYDSLRHYQAKNIEALRADLISGENEQTIQVEE